MTGTRRTLTDYEQNVMERVRDQVMAVHGPRQQELLAKLDAADNEQSRTETRRAMDDVDTELHIDTEELLYLVGKRDGFRLGFTVAQTICSAAGLTRAELKIVGLLLAGAAVDDDQLDHLAAAAGAATPDPLLEVG